MAQPSASGESATDTSGQGRDAARLDKLCCGVAHPRADGKSIFGPHMLPNGVSFDFALP